MRTMCLLFLFFASIPADAAFIMGSVETGAGMDIYPVSGAEVMVRIGTNPDEYPSVKTDNTGSFELEVPELPEEFMLHVCGDGVVSKTITLQDNGRDTLHVGSLLLGKRIETTLSFRGELLDSVTYKPLVGVTVRFKRDVMKDTSFYETVTDANGYFAASITVWNDDEGKAFWCIEYPDYRSACGEVTSKMTISRYCIELVPDAEGRLVVKGTVVDSITRSPLGNAQVILTTSYFKSTFDTVVTGADGTFSTTLVTEGTGARMPELYCTVSADCYCRREYVIALPTTPPLEFDAGEVSVLTDETGVHAGVPSISGAASMGQEQLFLVDGRMLRKTKGTKVFRRLVSPQLTIIRSKTAVRKRMRMRR